MPYVYALKLLMLITRVNDVTNADSVNRKHCQNKENLWVYILRT